MGQSQKRRGVILLTYFIYLVVRLSDTYSIQIHDRYGTGAYPIYHMMH
jgi:hypothetical protein